MFTYSHRTIDTIPAIPIHATTIRKRTLDSAQTRVAKRSKTDDLENGRRMPGVLMQNLTSQEGPPPPQSGSAPPRPSLLTILLNTQEPRRKSHTLTRLAESRTTGPLITSNVSIPERCPCQNSIATPLPTRTLVDHGAKVQQIENMVSNLRRKLAVSVHRESPAPAPAPPLTHRKLIITRTPAPRHKDVVVGPGRFAISRSKVAEMEHQLQVERETCRKLGELFNHVQRMMEILQLKLSEMDVEFNSERQRREELEKELANERKKRVEVENILKDVERECRAPFVVPAMMEAFKTISRLTR
ncbi:hypothetical protein APHAL10511_004022 [Amanita phalloides]|nr:hypothetical protein APHAL10511_004022 [Amanita phalloides]